jgi:hypothetical protein
MGSSLVTRSEYKSYANITSTNFDAQIDSLIPKISELIKSYCRRTFIDYVNDSKIETTNGGYGPALNLVEYPVIAVQSVDYSEDYGQTYTSLEEYVDYAVDIENGQIVNILSGDWPKVVNGYQISYTGGYETLPDDLKLAAFDLITYYMKNDSAIHSNKAPGTNSVQIEYVTSTALPSHIKRILDLYKASWD